MSQEKTETLIATIAGKEYVETSSRDRDNYYYNNGVMSYSTWKTYCYDHKCDKSTVYASINALLKIIESVEKNLTARIEALEAKLNQHIEADLVTQYLRSQQAIFDMLKEKHEALLESHSKLSQEHEKLQEEKQKLDEWKAQIVKQFE